MATTSSFDDTEIVYDDHGGGGRPVVLVHGITECRGVWDPIVERLSPTNRVIALDLRGHGQSGDAQRYDLEAMATDIGAVVAACGLDRPHLVGHSLGGAVVSAAGAAMEVGSVTNVDQSLQLDSFKAQVAPLEDQLKNAETFPVVIDGLFVQLAGDRIDPSEWERVQNLRRASQDVVLSVWDMMFTLPAPAIADVVDQALGGYANGGVEYLSLFGVDPGADYGSWLADRIPGATVEVWPDYGHYPHLVDPDRFVERLAAFWGAQ